MQVNLCADFTQLCGWFSSVLPPTKFVSDHKSSSFSIVPLLHCSGGGHTRSPAPLFRLPEFHGRGCDSGRLKFLHFSSCLTSCLNETSSVVSWNSYLNVTLVELKAFSDRLTTKEIAVLLKPTSILNQLLQSNRNTNICVMHKYCGGTFAFSLQNQLVLCLHH